MTTVWRDWFKASSDTLATVDIETRTVTLAYESDDDTWAAAFFYFQKREEFTGMDAATYKQEYEKWMPQRNTLLKKYEAGTLQVMKMEAFYDALQEGYSVHRQAIYALLAEDKVLGVVPMSQREAAKAGLAEGGGYRGKAVTA